MATSPTFQDGQTKVSKRVEKELHNTKVVVRRLPPDITEEKFFEMFTDIPKYNYFYLTAGDPTLGELATSRAYFSFVDESSIIPFRDKYDGVPLESAKGVKYRAVIEFAPYQGTPKRIRKKPDSRIATIEQDQDYLSFAETAHAKKEPPTMAEIAAYVDSLTANKVQEVQVTPLLSYLNDYRRGGRSSKRQKSAPGESKKKRSKESKSAKESRSKGDDATKSSGSGSKEWTGKSRKEKSGKKSDIDTVSSISSTSVERKGGSGGTERTKEKGKMREEGRGKGWKQGKGWRDESAWEGGSDHGRRKGEATGEGKKEKAAKRGEQRVKEAAAGDDGRVGDRGGYREKKSSRRDDEERKQNPSSIRNRDRPDQPIYSPRSRSRGGFNHTYSKEESFEGRRASKERGDSSRASSGKSEGWKRRDQVNGEKPKFRDDRDDFSEGGGAKSRGSSRRGRNRDSGYGESTPSYSDK